MEAQFFVRCPYCKFLQKDTRLCTDCHKEIPEYPTKTITKQVTKIVTKTVSDVWLGENLPTLADAEVILIREALRRYKTKTQAARALGIGKTTIYRKMKEWA